jgi:hypothetical protein
MYYVKSTDCGMLVKSIVLGIYQEEIILMPGLFRWAASILQAVL